MTADQSADASPPPKAGADAGILVTFRESPRAAKAMLAGVFVNRLGQFITVYLVLFMTSRGFTEVQAGEALGVYGGGAVVGVLVGGALADWLGARRATVLSMSGTAALIVGILYVHYFPALLVVVALVGGIGIVYRPASATLLSELTPKHRQVMIFALYRLCLNLGTTVSPLLGAVLISVSYTLLFWGEAAAALGYAIIAVLALPRRDDMPAPADGGQRPARERGRGGFRDVLVDRPYLLFLIALLINATVYVQYVSVLPLAMRAAGLATIWYGAVVSLNALIVITCELLMTKMTQRWPARVVALIGFTLLGCGQAIYSVPAGLIVFITGTLVWTLAEIIAGPTMSAYPAMAGPASLRGRYLGTSQAMFALGFAIGPPLGVALWHLVGRQVWWWSALACLLGAAAAWSGMRPSARDRWAASDQAATDQAASTGQAPGTGPAAQETA
jgi:MFS family permease